MSCISPTHNPYFPYTYVHIYIYSMEVPISSFSHSCPAYRLLRLWCGPCQERHSSLSFVGIQTFPNGPFSHDNLAFEGFSVEISMIRNLTRSVPRFVMEAVSASMLHTTWRCAPFAPKTNHVFPYGPLRKKNVVKTVAKFHELSGQEGHHLDLKQPPRDGFLWGDYEENTS